MKWANPSHKLIATSILITMLVATSVLACQVPVFRYALERWSPDNYEIVVLFDKALSDDQEKLVKRMANDDPANSTSVVAPNMKLRKLDIGSDAAKPYVSVWKQHAVDGQPLAVVLYPATSQDLPEPIAHVSPLNGDTVDTICHSPAREEIVKRLIDGDSAVWIFVPSGNDDLDQAALSTLQQQLAADQASLELPPQEEIESDEYFNPTTKIELRLSFSYVTVDRKDPKERMLIDSLLGSESDLKEFDQPLAFPVFGRGRVLYALVGAGISAETIRDASKFIIGPCSCQVKERNPGFDLLLTTDWDKHVGTVAEAIVKPTAPVLLQIPPGRKSREN